MAEHDYQESPTLDGLAKEVASLREENKALMEENKALWGAVTALGERVMEATGVEEIIRRARAGPKLQD